MKGFISPTLHPFKSLLLFTGFVVAGLFIGNFLAMVLVKVLWGFGLMEISQMLSRPSDYPESRSALVLFQGVVHLVGFTIASLAFLRFNAHRPYDFLSPRLAVPFYLMLASALLLLVIMPAASWVVHWNANIDFPSFLEAFERWAKAKEDELRELTLELTKISTIPQLILGLVVFAVLPAIGEELAFRGIVQRELQRWWRNPHLGIWVAAIVFGIIHMQFYGVVPRILLGVLFGYLYWWSGNIWVPILGHFINNGFMVLMMFLAQRNAVAINVESTEPENLPLSLFSVVLSAGILYSLYAAFRRLPSAAVEEEPRF
ncbi:CPBP family intramembrane glutamic endopeptidase [Rufibacter latericius]|uniref:CPBP family intramembrane metalloprotease n=1 Tax=Rufibacter latericius TaxID=2487040 RepID=A0A3M9MMT1_9BACT|nr:CPBP family intramembrane glutamic endopeptidase [Rufibacter latericius]RNI26801.1 CPBP family intramembrane metalloprotease [Rufibacter latericius]